VRRSREGQDPEQRENVHRPTVFLFPRPIIRQLPRSGREE
jgi:hypothetical protein